MVCWYMCVPSFVDPGSGPQDVPSAVLTVRPADLSFQWWWHVPRHVLGRQTAVRGASVTIGRRGSGNPRLAV